METYIDKVIEEMNIVAECVWKCEEDAYKRLTSYIEVWQQMLQQMLENMCYMQEQGVQVPFEIIMQQLDNFECALKKKDDFLLADVLKYELAETLKYYKGLMEIL